MKPLNVLKKLSVYALGSLFAIFSLLLIFGGCSNNEEKKSSQPKLSDGIPKKPNIIVIMTDQERHPMHWPEDWAEKNLVSSNRFKKHGLTFHRAYTAACECAPSRAVLTSSEH
jgi:hypothetical protein